MVGAWKKFFKGEGHNSEFEAGFREMFKDIVRYLENKKLAIFPMWMFKGKGQAWGRLGDCRGSSHVQLEKNSKVEMTIQLNLEQQNITKGQS